MISVLRNDVHGGGRTGEEDDDGLGAGAVCGRVPLTFRLTARDVVEGVLVRERQVAGLGRLELAHKG